MFSADYLCSINYHISLSNIILCVGLAPLISLTTELMLF